MGRTIQIYRELSSKCTKDKDTQRNLALSFLIFVFCDVCVSEALLSVLHISLAVRADDSGLGKTYVDTRALG